eukprot:2634938-Rhodomonas_salina.2
MIHISDNLYGYPGVPSPVLLYTTRPRATAPPQPALALLLVACTVALAEHSPHPPASAPVPVSATSAHSVLERPITIDQHYGSPRHYLNVRFILALVLSVASLHELVTVPNSSQTRTYCSPGNQRSHTRVQILTAAWCSAGRFQPHAIWIARSRTGAVGRAVGFRHYAGQNGVVAQRSISDREWRRSLVSRSDP